MKTTVLATGTTAWRSALAASAILIAATAWSPLGDASAATPVSASAEDERPRFTLPQALSPDDAELYRRIFALHAKARWDEADRLIAKLDSDLLLGYVMLERYMHPCCYRSKFRELRDWMRDYADLPEARRIYKLALRRRPQGGGYPKAPVRPAAISGPSLDEDGDTKRGPSLPRLSRKQNKDARYLRARFGANVRRGYVSAALEILNRNDIETLWGPRYLDAARVRLARVAFQAGEDRLAAAQAGAAAARSGAEEPMAYWIAGLASWRTGGYAASAEHFEALSATETASTWLRAAGAYWAARAHLFNRDPKQVNPWLRVAARYPRTFYGQIARRTLGIEAPFDWSPPRVSDSALATLMTHKPFRRALALIQVGQRRLAELELRRLYSGGGSEVSEALLAVSDAGRMPSLAVRIADQLTARDEHAFHAGMFPMPAWRPDGGFTIDRALLFAIMHQESMFNSHARSRSGARGVMQLMPRTASFIGRDRTLRGRGRNKLYDPEFNISLGQRYVQHLLEQEDIGGDVLLTTVAYNAGPGNLNKWRRRMDYQQDPLLFIEAIPLRETRIYVERVLANLWVYRHRLGQPTPSLDAIAAGSMPVYKALDAASINLADYEQD